MNKRILIIAFPAVVAIILGIITTVSLPINTLGPEKISLYTSTYQATDFSVDDLQVKYYNANELAVRFYISGGDGVKDLRFEFICRDESDVHIYSTTSGTMVVEAVGAGVTNSTTIENGDLVGGVLHWNDVPAGNQQIKAIISLQNIAVDTYSFYIGLRQN
jgi:hypothetical protein